MRMDQGGSMIPRSGYWIGFVSQTVKRIEDLKKIPKRSYKWWLWKITFNKGVRFNVPLKFAFRVNTFFFVNSKVHTLKKQKICDYKNFANSTEWKWKNWFIQIVKDCKIWNAVFVWPQKFTHWKSKKIATIKIVQNQQSENEKVGLFRLWRIVKMLNVLGRPQKSLRVMKS